MTKKTRPKKGTAGERKRWNTYLLPELRLGLRHAVEDARKEPGPAVSMADLVGRAVRSYLDREYPGTIERARQQIEIERSQEDGAQISE